MRSLALMLLVLMAGCCSLKSYEDMREAKARAEADLERQQNWVAGCQDDNAQLQTYGLELQMELRRWQMGSIEQAKREAQLREACDI